MKDQNETVTVVDHCDGGMPDSVCGNESGSYNRVEAEKLCKNASGIGACGHRHYVSIVKEDGV
jgi:hypothetical protein